MERWDAYDKDEKKIGRDLVRGENIPANMYHLLSDTVVQHKDGTFLLMQRSLNKKTWAGMFQVGAGGHVLKGETPIECAIRELKEESGIVCNDLYEIYTKVIEEEHAIYHGYLCIANCSKDSIILQEGETIAYKWISKDEFIQYMDSNECMNTQKNRLKDFVDSIR